jgi:hypothetical protein
MIAFLIKDHPLEDLTKGTRMVLIVKLRLLPMQIGAQFADDDSKKDMLFLDFLP